MDRVKKLIQRRLELAGFSANVADILPKIFHSINDQYDFIKNHYKYGRPIQEMQSILRIKPYLTQAKTSERDGDKARIYIRAKEVDVDLAEEVIQVFARMYTDERSTRWSTECLNAIRKTREEGTKLHLSIHGARKGFYVWDTVT
ncbi:hypothetical protein FPQ18DRAFT_393298 [Pyronema domesticum]|uniref:Uncharacterized protein n=1 Tax=Pyronema omphalodes (strain CBS 100304) TaxID=1076935 RepID=U4LV15_PYROM|nr:hypothetical protein FPQ18DRAFT_393298 [Pyronema domesticum]CCX32131.1 Protein of unknown function [Pyronema omphalodes CBS 100304]